MDTPCPEHPEKSKKKKKNSDENDEFYDDQTVYNIQANTDGDGYISGPLYAYAGDTITLTFNANPGSVLSNVVIDGVAQGAILSILGL